MDVNLYDNYEDDGQLSLFGMEEVSPEQPLSEQPLWGVETGVRIGHCSSCGKLLAVKEAADGYFARCNNCNIRYFQKK